MARRKLNVFQRVMRLWDEVHPYNAAQVLHLEGIRDLEKLAGRMERDLASLWGSAASRVDGARFQSRNDKGRACAQPVRVVDTGSAHRRCAHARR